MRHPSFREPTEANYFYNGPYFQPQTQQQPTQQGYDFGKASQMHQQQQQDLYSSQQRRGSLGRFFSSAGGPLQPPLTQPNNNLLFESSKYQMRSSRTPPNVAKLVAAASDYSGRGRNKEFRIEKEDFPELPGRKDESGESKTASAYQSLGSGSTVTISTTPVTDQHQQKQAPMWIHGPTGPSRPDSGLETTPPDQRPPSIGLKIDAPPLQLTPPPGIKTDKDGTVRDIPPSMLRDQYGIAGHLVFLRSLEQDPHLLTLAMGHELSLLGVNLTVAADGKRRLIDTFGGPFTDRPAHHQDRLVGIPTEYNVCGLGASLPPVRLNRYSDDLLFFIFYNFPEQPYQLAAAAELHARNWRFHTGERLWVTRVSFEPGSYVERTPNSERGAYFVFDPVNWKRLTREMTLEYRELEQQPSMPTALCQTTTVTAQQQQHPPLANNEPVPVAPPPIQNR